MAEVSRPSTFGAVVRVTSGNFIEMYDFFLFGFYANAISKAFFPAASEVASLMLTFASFGAGALFGALGAAALGRASTKVLLLGGALFSASELLLAPLSSALLAGAFLFLGGAGFTAWSANSNAIMQLAAPDHLRGRVIGLYFYAFNGTGALAGILTGWLCAAGGTELAFVVSGLIGIVAVGGTALFLGWTPRLAVRRRADQLQHA